MSTAYRILPYYTYEDYCRWEGQWELIEGIPYAMSPAPRPEHQAVATNIAAEFRAAIKQAHCHCRVYQPIDYKIADDTVLNPDLLVVCKPITKAFLDFPPALVAEILSPATALKDRHTKFDIYQQQRIPYYLMVDVDTKEVEVYHLSNDNLYRKQIIDPEAPTAFSFDDCHISIVLNDIWS